ncbi:MAG: OB-fold nucleic acid binding domain-containing protein [Candidatus Aenigmatarchaeota archaeon]
MKINELKNGMSNVSLRAKVIDISDKREVMTRYGKRSVADATIEDETGQVTLTLWGEQIKAVSIGDTVSITGAFVTEFRDKLQVSVPRSGRIVRE